MTPMRLRGTFVLTLSLALTGCIGNPPTQETGTRVGDETIRQIEVGVTTEAWLIAIVGPPTSQAVVQGVQNTSVLRYAHGETSSGMNTALMGVYSRTKAVTYFIVTDGIITRYWTDRAPQYTLMGNPVEEPAASKDETKIVK